MSLCYICRKACRKQCNGCKKDVCAWHSTGSRCEQCANRVVINDRYTYATDLELSIGDRVLLPTADHLRDVKGPTWEGTVTALTSEYAGECARVISKK